MDIGGDRSVPPAVRRCGRGPRGAGGRPGIGSHRPSIGPADGPKVVGARRVRRRASGALQETDGAGARKVSSLVAGRRPWTCAEIRRPNRRGRFPAMWWTGGPVGAVPVSARQEGIDPRGAGWSSRPVDRRRRPARGTSRAARVRGEAMRGVGGEASALLSWRKRGPSGRWHPERGRLRGSRPRALRTREPAGISGDEPGRRQRSCRRRRWRGISASRSCRGVQA